MKSSYYRAYTAPETEKRLLDVAKREKASPSDIMYFINTGKHRKKRHDDKA